MGVGGTISLMGVLLVEEISEAKARVIKSDGLVVMSRKGWIGLEGVEEEE